MLRKLILSSLTAAALCVAALPADAHGHFAVAIGVPGPVIVGPGPVYVPPVFGPVGPYYYGPAGYYRGPRFYAPRYGYFHGPYHGGWHR